MAYAKDAERQQLLHALDSLERQLDRTWHERTFALEQRDEALQALSDERSEREATELLLEDAVAEVCIARDRARQLEVALERVLRGEARRGEHGGGSGSSSHHHHHSSSSRGGSGLAANLAPSPGSSSASALFGLNKTRSAIEQAVKEAASLPPDERKKKVRALRLKWHPDKHEVLKDFAGEVSKMINEAVARHGAE